MKKFHDVFFFTKPSYFLTKTMAFFFFLLSEKFPWGENEYARSGFVREATFYGQQPNDFVDNLDRNLGAYKLKKNIHYLVIEFRISVWHSLALCKICRLISVKAVLLLVNLQYLKIGYQLANGTFCQLDCTEWKF